MRHVIEHVYGKMLIRVFLYPKEELTKRKCTGDDAVGHCSWEDGMCQLCKGSLQNSEKYWRHNEPQSTFLVSFLWQIETHNTHLSIGKKW